MRNLIVSIMITGLVFCSGAVMAAVTATPTPSITATLTPTPTPTPTTTSTPVGYKTVTPTVTPIFDPKPGTQYDQSLMYGIDSAGRTQKVKVGSDHGSIITMPHESESMHNGNLYVASDYKAVGNANTSYYWGITTLTGKYETTISAVVSGNGLLYFYAEPTFTGGTEIAFRNAYRGSSNTCLATFQYGVIPTLLGDMLEVQMGSAGVIGGASGTRTWLLNPGTKYLIRVYSNATSLTASVRVDMVSE